MIQDEVLAKVKRDASPQIETLGEATTCIEAFLTIEAGFELAIANVFTSESLIWEQIQVLPFWFLDHTAFADRCWPATKVAR